MGKHNKTTLMWKSKTFVFKTNPNHPILHVSDVFEESSTVSLHTLYSRHPVDPTVPTLPPHSKSRYTRHNRYTWNAHQLARPDLSRTHRCHHTSVRCSRRV